MFLLFLPFICFTYFTAIAQAAPIQILNVRYWAAPDHTRIVFDTTSDVEYTVQKEEEKLTLLLNNVKPAVNLRKDYALKGPGVIRVTLKEVSPRGVQIEIELTDQAQTKVFSLKKFADKPPRLVVDVTVLELERKENKERERIKAEKKEKIVVIDPGHGGDDPGAIGKEGTQEKEVVLQIGQKLKDMLNRFKDCRAFLTREGDYYVTFAKRMLIARQLGADLFISIHADAAKNREALGSSIYCLSLGAASNEAARLLAQKENLSDIIGGAIGEEGTQNEASDAIILDMFQTSTLNRARSFGQSLLKQISHVQNLKFTRIQEAPFRVLKFPDIPAVLVETAYISNPREEKKLKSETFQILLAERIAQAVKDFLSLREEREEETVLVSYRVKKGDNLTKIARKYGTEVAYLLRINKIAPSGKVHIGQIIKVPKKVLSQKGVTYTVKKGDTLAGIARKYNVSLKELMKINGKRADAPLYVGSKIFIPQP